MHNFEYFEIIKKRTPFTFQTLIKFSKCRGGLRIVLNKRNNSYDF